MGVFTQREVRRAIAVASGIAMIIGLAAPPVLAADPVATSIEIVAQETPVGGVPFMATVNLYVVDPAGPATDATGDVSVTEGATPLASCTLAAGTCDLTLTLGAGDHTLTVSYPGDAGFAPATADVTWSVVPNTVDATGVGLNRTTFYPYRDGYRDTVTARGTRNEAASVTIRVKSPTGRLLKKVALAKAAGAYAWSWNGRNSSGTMYPAGKYTITQTLSDGYMSKVWTNTVNLSAKRLYTYTKTLTKDYAHRSAQGSYSVAWQFTLPSATIYKKLVFAVYAKSSPAGGFGPHDFSACGKGTWDLGCAGPNTATIGSSYAWRKVTGSVSRNRTGSYVRLYALAAPRSALKYGRVIVTYQVLK